MKNLFLGSLLSACVVAPAFAQLPSLDQLKRALIPPPPVTAPAPVAAAAQPRAVPPGYVIPPECDKTRTLLSLCAKGTRPYGSDPIPVAVAPPPKAPADQYLLPGESYGQCRARFRAAHVGVTKGGCSRVEPAASRSASSNEYNLRPGETMMECQARLRAAHPGKVEAAHKGACGQTGKGQDIY